MRHVTRDHFLTMCRRMGVIRLSREDARQIAVRAQLLDATRPSTLVDLVDHLTLLQVDPTAAIAPNADLVAWSRLGASYQPADLTRALQQDRTLFELRAYIRPMSCRCALRSRSEWVQHRAESRGLGGGERSLSARHRRPTSRRWATALARSARHQSGPMGLERLDGQPQRHPDARAALRQRGGRDRRTCRTATAVGRARACLPTFRASSCRRGEAAPKERRLRSLGIARAKTAVVPGEPISVGNSGVAVQIEGLEGEWRADPNALDLPSPAVRRCCRRSIVLFTTAIAR